MDSNLISRLQPLIAQLKQIPGIVFAAFTGSVARNEHYAVHLNPAVNSDVDILLIVEDFLLEEVRTSLITQAANPFAHIDVHLILTPQQHFTKNYVALSYQHIDHEHIFIHNTIIWSRILQAQRDTTEQLHALLQCFVYYTAKYTITPHWSSLYKRWGYFLQIMTYMPHCPFKLTTNKLSAVSHSYQTNDAFRLFVQAQLASASSMQAICRTLIPDAPFDSVQLYFSSLQSPCLIAAHLMQSICYENHGLPPQEAVITLPTTVHIHTLGPATTDSAVCAQQLYPDATFSLYPSFEQILSPFSPQLLVGDYILIPAGYCNRPLHTSWVDYHFQHLERLTLRDVHVRKTQPMVLVRHHLVRNKRAIIHSSTVTLLHTTLPSVNQLQFVDSKELAYLQFMQGEYEYAIFSQKNEALAPYDVIKCFEPTMVWCLYVVT